MRFGERVNHRLPVLARIFSGRERFTPQWTPMQLAAQREAKSHFASSYAKSKGMAFVGASSEKFAAPPSFTNILYSHPSFGLMPEWGGQSKELLPPVNCQRALSVTPDRWRNARANWGYRTAMPPTNLPESMRPASPSKWAIPVGPLPTAPKLRAKATQVSKSTNPWLRRPPHTTRQKAIYEAMYGPSPNSPAGQSLAMNKAASTMQAAERGRRARKKAKVEKVAQGAKKK